MIKNIQFQQNSHLRIIEKRAFNESKIESINVPPTLKIIGDAAFRGCWKLSKVNIPENSELVKIDEYALDRTSIESIKFPTKLVEFGINWCLYTPYLKQIDVMKGNPYFLSYNSQYIFKKALLRNKNYDILFLAARTIETAVIPSFIRIIHMNAFSHANKLKNVVFSNNSKLKKIGELSFYSSALEKFTLPHSVVKIDKSAFYGCSKLQCFEIPENSKLSAIGSDAFYMTKIESMYIPKNVTRIGKSAFRDAKLVEIDENSKLSDEDFEVFSESAECILMIPHKKIKDLDTSYLRHEEEFYD